MKYWQSLTISFKTFLRLAFFLWFVGLISCFLLPKFDIHHSLNSFHTRFLDLFFSGITFLGDGVFAVILALIFFIKNKTQGIQLLLTFLISALLAQLLKNFVFADFMRPYYYIQSGQIHVPIIEGVKMHTSHSFPSGHTTTIFAITSMLSSFYPSKIMGFSLFLIAVLVGYSRIYLSQHFLEDALLGSFIGVFTSYTIGLYFRKKRSINNNSTYN